MALLSVIRRWHFRQQIPIREIERRTGLSRNTIRKYLRADLVEPKFKLPDRPSKLDPFAEKLAGWLRQEASKSRKHKRTTKQLHADLVVLVMMVPMAGWRHLFAAGRRTGSVSSRPPAVAPDRAPWRGVGLATSSRSPARLAGFIRLPRRAA